MVGLGALRPEKAQLSGLFIALFNRTSASYIALSLGSWFIVIVIVIVNSKLLKYHSKAKRRAPAYSRALHQIRRVFQ